MTAAQRIAFVAGVCCGEGLARRMDTETLYNMLADLEDRWGVSCEAVDDILAELAGRSATD